MRRQHSPHHVSRRGERQFDLFAPPSADSTIEAPEWRTLPEVTRRAVTSLMVRLILEHADGNHHPQTEEVCHDD